MNEKIALVAEGGGMRGIFTAGVLDVFQEQEYDPFQFFVGVSAGAQCLSSFICKQHKRSHRVISEMCLRPEFISWSRYLRGGHYMDTDWLMKTLDKEDPLDVSTGLKNLENRIFKIVITDVATALPVYLEPKASTWQKFLHVSSSMPIIRRGFIKIAGEKYTDGAIGDSIPVKHAYFEGYRKIVLIRTYPKDVYYKKRYPEMIIPYLLRRFPEMAQACSNSTELYNQTIDWMKQTHVGLKLEQIAPKSPLRIANDTQDPMLLEEYYEEGRQAALEYLIKNGIPLRHTT